MIVCRVACDILGCFNRLIEVGRQRGEPENRLNYGRQGGVLFTGSLSLLDVLVTTPLEDFPLLATVRTLEVARRVDTDHHLAFLQSLGDGLLPLLTQFNVMLVEKANH